jgi:hypothetical protein
MAINKNHEFEELNGVKCGIVEKNATPERVAFLKDLLEFNGFTVIVAPSPLAKPATPPKPPAEVPVESEDTKATPPPAPETFTIGVTDLTFNPVNAIFGRLLKAKNGQVVTLEYWRQKTDENNDEVPYYETE